MKILIAYETYSGGTLNAAQFVFQSLVKKGCQVSIKRAGEVTDTEFNSSDFIIFATPSWLERNVEGQPHANFLKLMDAKKQLHMSEKKIAIFGLGDESYAHFCRGADILEKFVKDGGGSVIAKTLKLASYYSNPQDCQKKLQLWLDALPL